MPTVEDNNKKKNTPFPVIEGGGGALSNNVPFPPLLPQGHFPIPPIPPIPPVFAYDIENRLGRANGNVYMSKPGIPNVHDGQIMVRLKKKRCIIIDYGINSVDYPGFPKKNCLTPGCNKIGVPILMFDSVPQEPASLYLRSGLCFTCQRALNEKRRTQRKRKKKRK